MKNKRDKSVLKSINMKGVTLIALVMTAVIMLILAAVAISTITNKDDLINKTKMTKEKWEEASKEEIGVVNEQSNILYEFISSMNNSGVEIPDEIRNQLANHETIKVLLNSNKVYKWDSEYYTSFDKYSYYYYTGEEPEIENEAKVQTPTESSESGSGGKAEEESESTGGKASNVIDLTINEWKILKINSDNTVVLVPVSLPDAKVLLEGAQGYNNGVDLLNNLCETLYSGEGYTARSVNIEDIEAAYTENIRSDVRTNYPNQQASSNFTSAKSYYPSIYGEEKFSQIGNTYLTSGLECSQKRGSFIEKANEKMSSDDGIRPTANYYSYSSLLDDLENEYTEDKEYSGSTKNDNLTSPREQAIFYASSFFPADGGSYYWVASRSIRNATYRSQKYAQFGMMTVDVDYEEISAETLYSSDGDNKTSYYDYTVFPIVTLKSGALMKVSGSTYSFSK